MKKVIVIVLIIALVALLTVGLVACNDNNNETNGWSTKEDALFYTSSTDTSASLTGTTLKVSFPEGTPALAICHMVTENPTICGANMQYGYEVPATIASMMASATSDIIIMPINTGANLIANKGADYKLVSIAVDGSLYMIGNKEGSNEILLDDIKGKTIACIGQGAVPGLTVKYVLENSGIEVIEEGSPTNNQVKIVWAANGQLANSAVVGGTASYAVVGEPAATALSASIGYNARMNIQSLYSTITGDNTYPQAGLFVRTSLASNKAFMTELFAALQASKEWVQNNAADVTAYAKAHLYDSAAFPAPSIPRCAINCQELTDLSKSAIIKFLDRIYPLE